MTRKCATDEWTRAVVAVGMLRSNWMGERVPILAGTGICIDSQRRMLTTAAHVLRETQKCAVMHPYAKVLDPLKHGVAIGFKPLEPERAAKGEIDWVDRATLCESPGVLDPPSPAAPNGLDLVVLQLTQQLDGSPLAPDAVLIDAALFDAALFDAALFDAALPAGHARGAPARRRVDAEARRAARRARPRAAERGVGLDRAARVPDVHRVQGPPLRPLDRDAGRGARRPQRRTGAHRARRDRRLGEPLAGRGRGLRDRRAPPVDPPSNYTVPLQCIWGAVAAALNCPEKWQQADVLREMLRGEGTIEAGTHIYDPDGVREIDRRLKDTEKPDGLAALGVYNPDTSKKKRKEAQPKPAPANSVAGSLLSAFDETGSIAPSETEMPNQQQMFAIMRQMQAQMQAQDVELHATREELQLLRKQRDVDNSLVGLFNTGRPKTAAATVQAHARRVAARRELIQLREAKAAASASARRLQSAPRFPGRGRRAWSGQLLGGGAAAELARKASEQSGGAELDEHARAVLARRDVVSVVIDDFSSITSDAPLSSQAFEAAGREWKIAVRPRGWGGGKGTHLGVYLQLVGGDAIDATWDLAVVGPGKVEKMTMANRSTS